VPSPYAIITDTNNCLSLVIPLSETAFTIAWEPNYFEGEDEPGVGGKVCGVAGPRVADQLQGIR
jgi:hypothetical protein